MLLNYFGFFLVFHDVVFSQTSADYEEMRRVLLSSPLTRRYIKWRLHIIALLQRAKLFVAAFRGSDSHGHMTNNNVERFVAACQFFRKLICRFFIFSCLRCVGILKDIVLCRVRAFNPVALANYLLDKFDKFFARKLLEFAVSRHELKTEWLRYTEAAIVDYKRCNNEREEQSQESEEQGRFRDVFDVTTAKGARYKVNLSTWLCDCPYGRLGRFCKHLVSMFYLA